MKSFGVAAISTVWKPTIHQTRPSWKKCTGSCGAWHVPSFAVNGMGIPFKLRRWCMKPTCGWLTMAAFLNLTGPGIITPQPAPCGAFWWINARRRNSRKRYGGVRVELTADSLACLEADGDWILVDQALNNGRYGRTAGQNSGAANFRRSFHIGDRHGFGYFRVHSEAVLGAGEGLAGELI